VVCADAVAPETGAPDEACPPGMRANAVCMLSADYCASSPAVACATAPSAETGAPDEACPPGMRVNAVCMLSAT